jgi:hypothetical protein
VTALEFHCSTVQCRELLQSLDGNRTHLIRAAAIRMQHGYATAISVFELGQSAAGIQSQDLV